MIRVISRKLAFAIEILHLLIVLIWVGLFFVPTALWEGRVVFHYWFIIGGTLLQIITGIFYVRYTKGLVPICPLSVVTQRLKGYGWTDERTYTYVFVKKVLKRLHLAKESAKETISKGHTAVRPLTFPFSETYITAIIVILQYHFGILVF